MFFVRFLSLWSSFGHKLVNLRELFLPLQPFINLIFHLNCCFFFLPGDDKMATETRHQIRRRSSTDSIQSYWFIITHCTHLHFHSLDFNIFFLSSKNALGEKHDYGTKTLPPGCTTHKHFLIFFLHALFPIPSGCSILLLPFYPPIFLHIMFSFHLSLGILFYHVAGFPRSVFIISIFSTQ